MLIFLELFFSYDGNERFRTQWVKIVVEGFERQCCFNFHGIYQRFADQFRQVALFPSWLVTWKTLRVEWKWNFS